jgi:hypothetical protein
MYRSFSNWSTHVDERTCCDSALFLISICDVTKPDCSPAFRHVSCQPAGLPGVNEAVASMVQGQAQGIAGDPSSVYTALTRATTS